MWANAQRDGRPAEYRWRPLLECRALTLPRRESRWNLQGCPKLANKSHPLVGRSSPYYEDMWKRYRCLTSFFRLSIAAKIQPGKVVRCCQNGDFLRPAFPASRVQHVSDLHSKFALSHTVCGRIMVDIQSPTADIRRGKKEKRRKKKKIETTGQKYNGLPYYIGRP